MSSKDKIYISDNNDQILFKYELDEIDKLYRKALELESFDIEFKIEIPSLPESLAIALGQDSSKIFELKEEIACEIKSHT